MNIFLGLGNLGRVSVNAYGLGLLLKFLVGSVEDICDLQDAPAVSTGALVLGGTVKESLGIADSGAGPAIFGSLRAESLVFNSAPLAMAAFFAVVTETFAASSAAAGEVPGGPVTMEAVVADGLNVATAASVAAQFIVQAAAGFGVYDVAIESTYTPSGDIHLTYTTKAVSMTFVIKAPSVTFTN